jgi:hypothetical protein
MKEPTTMRSRLILLGLALLIALALAPEASAAAGSITVSSSGGSVATYTVTWTSSAGGAVSGNPVTLKAGHITQVELVPGSAGTQPTDLYDVLLNNANAVDFLIGGGANLSNATPKLLQINPPLYHNGSATFDLVISNAGNAKTGTIVITVAP